MVENLDIEFLEEYLEKYPDSLMFARLADAYLKTNKPDKALELCEEGIRKHPYYITGHFVLGKCYFAKKQFEEAEKEFKRVLLFDPKYLAAHKYYGDVMKEIGWENTSSMSYKKILQIDPLDEVARSIAGEYIIESEKPPESSESFPEKGEEREDIDSVDAIEPLPVSPEEEDLLFEDKSETEQESEREPFEPEEEQIDDRKAEEYSSLLDDIFKDEVVEETPSEPPQQEEKKQGEEDIFKDLDQSPESYLADLDFEEEPDSQQESKPRRDVPPAFDDVEPSQEQKSKSMPFDFAPEPETKEPQSPSPSPEPEQKKSQKNKIVTPTLGEIYAAQGQYAKAIDVFETLLKKHPDNEFYSKKITELQQKLAETKDAS